MSTKHLPPIYSIGAECRDCYKCIRHCPVKAIRVVNDHAVVTPEACILCGTCVATCEHGAKRVRSDLLFVHHLVRRAERPVYASLAPSFISEFPNVRPAQMFTALKKLGFTGVHETAEGADLVSQHLAKILDESKGGIYLSTACPVAVELVRKYYPNLTPLLTPVLPPMMAHARQLRERYGDDIDVVFIGPCIGKKRDADNSDELAAAMTFEALRRWFKIRKIDPATMEDDPEYHHPGTGAFYPIEGGMNKTTQKYLKRKDMDGHFLVVSGVEQIQDRLEALPKIPPKGAPIFLEMLACPGGCISGPKSSSRSKILSQIDIQDYAENSKASTDVDTNITSDFPPVPIEQTIYTPEKITEALHKVGKYTPEDELNCGGCGYDNCRAFARALLRGDAEPQMCVSHMRQLAQKKSNALAKSIPFGFAMADSDLLILESNELFGGMFDESTRLAYEASPGLVGVELCRILPFPTLFEEVLNKDVPAIKRHVSIGEKIYDITIFEIERHMLVGVLVSDITDAEQKRQQLMEKSKEVIQNTTKTVQEIAYMLGKNSAQSELILSSLMDMFQTEKADVPEE